MSKKHRRLLRSLPHPRPTKARPIRLQANGISVARDKASQCWMREFEALLATPEMQKRIMDSSINIALYGTPWPEDWVKAHGHLRQYFAPLSAIPEESKTPTFHEVAVKEKAYWQQLREMVTSPSPADTPTSPSQPPA